MSVSLVLSICVFFILLIQVVNGATFLIILFFIFFGFGPSAAMFGTVIVPLTSIYASL